MSQTAHAHHSVDIPAPGVGVVLGSGAGGVVRISPSVSCFKVSRVTVLEKTSPGEVKGRIREAEIPFDIFDWPIGDY